MSSSSLINMESDSSDSESKIPSTPPNVVAAAKLTSINLLPVPTDGKLSI